MANGEAKTEAKESLTKARDLDLIRESLRDLRFGSVTIVVQDGVIVQIDRTEKRRIRNLS